MFPGVGQKVGQGGTSAETFLKKNLRTISNLQLAPFVQFQICHFLVTFQIAKRRLILCNRQGGQKVGQGGTSAETFLGNNLRTNLTLAYECKCICYVTDIHGVDCFSGKLSSGVPSPDGNVNSFHICKESNATVVNKHGTSNEIT